MFDAVRNNKRIVQIFLGLITLPFAFWGIDSYMHNLGAGSDLASVGDTKIGLQQFEQALRERQDQMRRSMGAAFRPEMMNSPQVRLSILNGLIDQRLLLLEAAGKRLTVGNQALYDSIASLPAFQEGGKFSQPRYETLLRGQGMSPEQFEARMRQDMILQQLVGTIGASAFASAAQAETVLRIQSEERQFSEFKIAAASFADKVKIAPEDLQKFYDGNRSRFETPERVKAEYVVLSVDALMPRVAVSDAEIDAWYGSHPDNYRLPEERRASHILIAFNDGDKEKAKARAEEVLKEVRRDPSRFADLARERSQDPGSAKEGGDLGFFARDAMVKPFADAAFGQKEGEISGLVESDFGYHIIKLTGIREAKERPLSEVRAEITDELKRQAAARQFAEAAENFSNLVYEQSDSLQQAADRFGLKIERTDWIPKNADPQVRAALGPLDDDRAMAALFSEDVIKNRHNTEALEVAPNTLLAARALEHEAAALRPFDEVRNGIEKTLRDEEAMKQAQSAGEARLAELRKGEDSVAWSEARETTRMQAARSQLPMSALQAIFKADAQKLPAYAGASVDDGYLLFKITKAAPPEKIDDGQLKAIRSEYAKIIAEEDVSAYLSGLRSRYKIDINTSLLENRER
ncbi:MAG: SurA N-terminal domain-containing protein [Candidatus Accumulibacter sp.]|jgi:peptidyl-prolyl cis-trans isomerase D|nr:SurA N-terminal domain-containing protein [Accumulibacter sp.]